MLRNTVSGSATSYRSVETAFRMLDAFSPEAPEWRVTGLARRVGSSKSTASRLLRSIERSGYLRRTPAGGAYAPSLRFLRLAEVAQGAYDVGAAAEPFVRELWRRTRGTVALRVLEGHELVKVSIIEAPAPVRVSHPKGGRVPYNFGAYGKALLAFMDAGEVERLLQAHPPRALTPRTPVARERLREALNEVRRRGVAFSDEEAVAGTRAVAAPVWDHRGRPVAALGVSFPVGAAAAPRVQRLGHVVRDVAARLSAQLGARRGRARDLGG